MHEFIHFIVTHLITSLNVITEKEMTRCSLQAFLHVLAFSSALSFRCFCHLFKSILQTRQFFETKVWSLCEWLHQRSISTKTCPPPHTYAKCVISKSWKLKRLITDLEVHQDGVMTPISPLKWQLSYMCASQALQIKVDQGLLGFFVFVFWTYTCS